MYGLQHGALDHTECIFCVVSFDLFLLLLFSPSAAVKHLIMNLCYLQFEINRLQTF